LWPGAGAARITCHNQSGQYTEGINDRANAQAAVLQSESFVPMIKPSRLSGVVKAVFATLVGLAATTFGHAEDFPARPIRVLVGSAPGGAADVSARLAAEALGRALDNSVFVELRGGAGGLNAVETFLAGEPDGYTILLAAVGSFTIIPAGRSVSYDAENDFIPLGIVWRSAQVLTVRAAGAPTLARFIADAKTRPGALTIGSAGVGTVTHLTIELLKREAGIDVIHVPFRGTGAALPAVLGGQIDAMFSDIGIIDPQLRAGTLRGLVVAAAQRAPALPETPTMGEAGLPGVTGDVWFGFVVSAKTPPMIVKRLQDAVAAAHEDPIYRGKVARLYASVGEPGPQALARLIATETAKWRAVISAAGIKLE
jgi:tripartite-type tricarboxylate transporter receptor subunit TctC